MAGYSKDLQDKITTAQELRDRMRFAGTINAVKGGIEIEFHFQDLRKSPNELSLASDGRVLELKTALNTASQLLVDEMGGQMGEIATSAYPLSGLGSLMREIADTRGKVIREALAHDLKPSPYAVLADYDHDAFLDNIIRPTPESPDRGERQRAMLTGFACHLDEKSVDYPVQNSAIHISHGAADIQHYFECYRRNAALMPFLMMVMENRPPYVSGKRQNTHEGIIARSALGERGLIPSIVFDAKDAEDFIKNYYDHLLSSPMLAYVAGNEFRASTDKGVVPPSFKDLVATELNTLSNALQALSMTWPSLKLAKIRDQTGKILGDRLETRDMDPGAHQPFSAALAVLLPAMDRDCGREVDDLLRIYNFNLQDMSGCRAPVMLAFARAASRGDDFMKIEYGSGTMLDFARDYGRIIKRYAEKYGLADYARPLVHICETGETDAMVLARRLKSYKSVLDFQRNYDAESLFLAPVPSCLSLLEADGKLDIRTRSRPRQAVGQTLSL